VCPHGRVARIKPRPRIRAVEENSSLKALRGNEPVVGTVHVACTCVSRLATDSVEAKPAIIPDIIASL
jgi:hypothetical protein